MLTDAVRSKMTRERAAEKLPELMDIPERQGKQAE